MLDHILPLIPPHNTYVEPFFGGGAVFFAKQPVMCEVINDIDNNAITFYRVLKSNFERLHQEIDCTLHSEAIYRFTKEIYQNPEKYNDLQVAYSFWVQCNMSFGQKPLAGFAYRNRGGEQIKIKAERIKKKS